MTAPTMIMMLIASSIDKTSSLWYDRTRPNKSNGFRFRSRPTRITPYKHLKNPQQQKTRTKQSAHRGFDVDCFPRQDKQPVTPQQDIPPTSPTATDTPNDLIESSTDKSTDTDNNNNDTDPSDDDDDDITVIHDNRYHDASDDDT